MEEISKNAISSAKIPEIEWDPPKVLSFVETKKITIGNLTLNEFSFGPDSTVYLLDKSLIIDVKLNLTMRIDYTSNSK